MGQANLEPATLIARADLRRRWRSVLAVGVLFGIAGGIGVASIAGARRTASVFDRHLEATNGAQIEIDPGSITPEADAALRSLPNVTDASYWVVVSAYVVNDAGDLDERMQYAITFTTDGRYLDNDRVVASEGRRLDPSAPNEIMVNESFADASGLGVGDSVPIAVMPSDENGMPTTMTPDPASVVDMTITGIMVLNEEITSEQIDIVPRIFLSPAAVKQEIGEPGYFGFAWYGLRVDGGEEAVTNVRTTWQQLADQHNATVDVEHGDEPWLSYVHLASDLQRKASRAGRPLTTTLAAFGLLALLAVLVLLTQAMSRQVRSRRNELSIERVLGLERSHGVLVGLAAPAVTAAAALVAAAVTATFGSLLFPVGPFSVLEPSPGLDLDPLVLTIGLASIAVLPLVGATITARHEVRLASVLADRSSTSVGWLTRTSTSSGASPPLAAAMRLTFEPGRGRRFVPTRSVLVSLTIIVASLVTVIVFGSNLRTLDNEPSRFGWPADAIVMSDGGYGPFDKYAAMGVLDDSPLVSGYRAVAAGLAVVNGSQYPVASFGPNDPTLQPTMIEGHAPSQRNELVLGQGTMDQLGVEIGDKVTVGNPPDQVDMLVTGTAVFPVLGPVLAVRTGLDQGVWLHEDDYKQIDAVAAYIAYGLPDEQQFSLILVDLADGATVAELNELIQSNPEITLGSSLDVFGVIKPSEVRTAASSGGRSQTWLAIVLAAVAGLSMVLALGAVVRRRRRDLAMYRVLGFTPSQVRATFVWQGVLMATIATIIGVPVGIGVGRTLWRLFAERLGVVPDPTIPVTALVIATAVTFVIGVFGSLGPAITAARVKPAAALRSE